ncbi:MAG: UDP-diphosphatase, partial [Ignavibacteria bacterium]|nr:UDP-diphosphatase [Ignavibacteria bacterium]
ASLLSDARRGALKGPVSGWSEESRMALFMIAGTFPIGIAGLTLSDFLHGVFTKNLVVIGSSLIILALFLWLAEKRARHVRDMKHVTFADAMIIGLAQCLALIPGSSRSGTTMTAGLFLGLTRSAAARFSFLLSVPAVAASGLYELVSLTSDPFEFGIANVVVAVLFSAISGYAAIAWLLRYLMKQTMMLFVWYRIAIGVILLSFVFTGLLSP